MSAPLGDVRDAAVAVVGLGYVGLPLAVEFGRTREVVGYDIDSARVKELGDGHDHTLEVPRAELASASHLRFTDDPADLADCLARALESSTLQGELTRKSLARAELFSWARTARETADVYRKVAS